MKSLTIIMNCYLCQPTRWIKDHTGLPLELSAIGAKLDKELLQRFRETDLSSVSELSQMLSLIDLYESFKENIKSVATRVHQKCAKHCDACGQTIPGTGGISSSDCSSDDDPVSESIEPGTERSLRKRKAPDDGSGAAKKSRLIIPSSTPSSTPSSIPPKTIPSKTTPSKARSKVSFAGSQKPFTATPVAVSVDDEFGPLIQYCLGFDDKAQATLDKLTAMRDEIRNIDAMVGMGELKAQFLTLIKTLSTIDKNKSTMLMNIMISGPPGHGKTEIAKLFGAAFKKSGFLSKGTFTVAKRADLIGAYCGHTAINTTKMFDTARGGIIFIDEVYALGNTEKSDVFTQECIDTINQLLSERTDTLCIIAGYEKEIFQRFFAYNEGLARRFPWRFNIEKYGKRDLVAIFHKILRDLTWTAASDALLEADIDDKLFTNAGGDIANLITNCITCHFNNTFLQTANSIISRRDVLDGLRAYIKHRKRSDTGTDSRPPNGMYI